MRYLLNSAVLTSPGEYNYRLVDINQAVAWLLDGEFVSAIRYDQTAEALSMITGVDIPTRDTTLVMEAGDEALVFRLVFPPGTPRVPQGLKGSVDPEWLRSHSELGVLVKTK